MPCQSCSAAGGQLASAAAPTGSGLVAAGVALGVSAEGPGVASSDVPAACGTIVSANLGWSFKTKCRSTQSLKRPRVFLSNLGRYLGIKTVVIVVG